VDPRLTELADTVSHKRMYLLSRDEIAHYGIETRGFFETQWITSEAANRFTVLKSVTSRTSSAPDEYLTTTFQLWCELPNGASYFGYSRELPLKATSRPSSFQVSAGVHSFSFYVRAAQQAAETGIARPFLNRPEFLINALGSGPMTLTETLSAQESSSGEPRNVKISSAGLPGALAEFRKRCPA